MTSGMAIRMLNSRVRSSQPMHQVPARDARQPYDEQDRRECRDAQVGDALQEGAQIGEERELAHEEHQDHAQCYRAVAEQRQHVGG
jgi:hypothetical protein